MKSKTVLAVVVAGSLVALLPAAAAATTPTAVSFSNSRAVTSITYGPGFAIWFDDVSVGTSVATGAISGSFDLVDHAKVIQEAGSAKSTHYGTIHIDSVLTSAAGTITMQIQGQFVSANPDGTETVLGNWTIVGGTGSYAGLHGTGTDDTTIDTTTETITDTLTGYASYPGS